jgi:Protein of unknown function (DUF1571)
MLHKYKTILLAIFALAGSFILYAFNYQTKSVTPTHYDTEQILNNTLLAIARLKTVQYKLEISERINGQIAHKSSAIKLNVSPRKIYIKLDKKEILWVSGQNGGNALVNPGTFPYVSLNLDPFSTIMRKDQHHTIHELGFGYIYSILNNYKSRFGDAFHKHFFITGEEVFQGRECYKLTVLVPDFEWEPYEVLKGENLVSIARKKYVSEYMLLEKNTDIGWYNDVKEGQTIFIPNAYTKYTKILIDKQNMLPVSNTMIDEKGLFESYKYTNVRVNAAIPDAEFTRTYKDYNF